MRGKILNKSTSVKYPEYEKADARLETYAWWPKYIGPQPELLCNAGFFYTGRSDRVICYACGGGLKDWQGNEDPWVEHAVSFQHCSFLIKEKGVQFVKKIKNY